MTGRRLAAALCWTAAAAVAVRGATGTVNTARSLAWLRRTHAAHPPAPGQRPHVVMVVPMLREQSLIAATIDYFRDLAQAWGPATIVVATTEREHRDHRAAAARLPHLAKALRHRRTAPWLRARYAGVLPSRDLDELADHSGDPNTDYLAQLRQIVERTPSTPELAAKIAAASGGTVRHHHHPDPGAVMVDQINAAVDAELARLAAEGHDPRRVWIGIYNADSRPHPDTLAALGQVPADRRAVQQSAVHTATLGARPGPGGWTCDGAALLQSRWSLAREIPRLRAQAAQARRTGVRWPRLAHCTGHGLFLRGDLWHEHGGLPTATMNEDLAFGYQLSAAGEPIEVLPLLEVADSPTSVPILIGQHRQWFFSYPQYPAAARLAAAAGLGARHGRGWLTLQGLARGALWLGQSPAIAATLLLPAVAARRPAAAGASAAALALYLWAPVAMLTAVRHPGRLRRFGGRDLAGVTAAALLSSAGPWWCLADSARAALAGSPIEHGKTER
ncbi:hypothetical protein [Actinoplanes sp. NPDC051851]|uniref:hypothetical protein n=1 Tax=Actinoplanes sp. NPDC051851 TaxID=3154753 RepID=UPI00343612AE